MSRGIERTVDTALITGDARRIYDLAADVQRWPDILPHYRWVRVLSKEAGQQTVEMAAKRSWIPVKWIAVQSVEPADLRIGYNHIGGLTRGMQVQWVFEETGEDVQVTIVHEMSLLTPIVRTAVGRWIVGSFFVHHIAQRTLRRIKELVEEGAAQVA